MHIIALATPRFGQHMDLLAAMFRARRRVFKERLDWGVSIPGISSSISSTLKPLPIFS